MSWWTYVEGQVTVVPDGRGPHAKRFVIEEVLEHLPRVTGSEGPMEWKVVQVGGSGHSSNSDEFGIQTNLRGRHGWWEENDEYVIVLKGNLRDRMFDETLREFSKWLFRLARRTWVRSLLVKVSDGYGRSQLFDQARLLSDIHFSEVCEGRDRDGSRLSSNWRYGIMPDVTYWPHGLVNLVPGGAALANERDAMLGLLEREEYLQWGDGRYVGVNQELRERLLEGKAELDAVLTWLDEQDGKYRE